jgi:opacity protein-like surface antigen
MRKLILILLVFSFSALNFAGDVSRKGTTGADQLLIPVGAESIASGGAFLSRVSGVEALYYNPAGLDLMSGTEAMFSYMNYVADLGISYFAIGTQLGELGSFALSFKSIAFGDIPITTFENPDGTGQFYSPTFFVGTLSYSKAVTDRVSAGFNFKLVNESIMDASASGIALDFGVQYRFSESLSIAAVIKNLGTNMKYSGEDLKIKSDVPGGALESGTGIYEADTETFQMPSFFELSFAYNFNMDEQNNLAVATTFRQNNSFEDELMAGLEYGFTNMFFLRGGYNFLLENSSDHIFGFTLGAGINYETAGGLAVIFDYAYRDVREFDSANHIFTVKLAFE